jgi:hypothetical protein
VKTIYEKLEEKFKFEKKLNDKSLKTITTFVREFRQKLRKYNQQANLDEKILSEDLNDAWHFLYIRFYEKLLKNILSTEKIVIDLEEEVLYLFNSYLSDVV